MIVSSPVIPVDISIIIVNWKSADYVRKCLGTICRNMGGLAFEIIVIDNASCDGCDAMLADHYPHVMFIQSPGNVGFSAANNIAYKQSRGQTLLFLNPDTEVIDQALPTMHRLLWESPNAGAIGCTLLNTDGSLQTSCIQAFPTIINQVLDAEVLRRWFPLLSLWGTRPLFRRSDIPMPVEVVSGACLMVKRHVFESAGLFSLDYFMYAEDADLCYRLRSAGFVVYYTAAASVIHHGGGSSKQREHNCFAVVVMRESLFRFMTNYHGKLYGYLYRVAMGGAALCRMFILTTLQLCFWGGDNASHKALAVAISKWKTIFRWSLGVEHSSHIYSRGDKSNAIHPS